MSLISLKFIIFLFVALTLYYNTSLKNQWKILLIISYSYYLINGLQTVLFLIFTSLVTFYAGIRIGRINDEYEGSVKAFIAEYGAADRQDKLKIREDEDKRKRKILILILLINFGILFGLKYSNLVESLQEMLPFGGGGSYFSAHSIIIPLGISYYTFQSVGYVIDVYRRKYDPEKDVFQFMLFVSFFPQLIQGPISRYDDLKPKLVCGHRFNQQYIKYGIELAMWGLFKKLVIADRIAIITTEIFLAPSVYRGFFLIVATFLSMIELYADFSGGIDIIRGISQMFGIELMENFTRPFFSKNMAEYWRRWHISLNNWWRDYVFYPLSLSKTLNRIGKGAKKIFGIKFGKKLPILISIIIVRIINSIWHGATGSSILGGLYYGVILAFSFYFEDFFKAVNVRLKINTECFSWRVFQYIRTFVLIAMPRLVCKAQSVSDGAYYFKCLFSEYNPWILFDGSLLQLGVTGDEMVILIAALMLLLAVSLYQEKGCKVGVWLDEQNYLFRVIVMIFFVYSIILFGIYGSGYNASSFAYAQF